MMRTLMLVVHEAWNEFRFGLQSGVITLVFLGLTAYLLMTLANADYIQKMGATDIPRNAPAVIYLMVSGCLFFLFFAWAWLFSQALLRDRQASLHEIFFSTPNSLQALLWGRFIGASIVGILLGSATIIGFLIAPVLSWLGWVPAESIAPAPWQALFFAWWWLLVPACLGIGALYFLATLWTRNIAAAFGLSAFLMLLWMFAVVVLKEGNINDVMATSLDPSLFTFTHAQTETWTPQQKATAFLPLTPAFLLNRFLWCVLPLIALAWGIQHSKREALTLEHSPKAHPTPHAKPAPSITTPPLTRPLSTETSAPCWLRILFLETRWQLQRLFHSRLWWTGCILLTAMGVLSAFIHVVWHAEGPMAPRPDMLLPLLKDALFLIIAFLIAALGGIISRRDDVPGFRDILEATPAPDYVLLFGRALTIIIATCCFTLLPGLSGIITTALTVPAAFSFSQPLLFQALIITPPLIELSMLVLLAHVFFRHAGVAYTVSILLTFFLILNHELELITYPPYQIGIPAKISLSALIGWSPWLHYLTAIDIYKLALGALLISLAGFALPRGHDNQLRYSLQHFRTRLKGPFGIIALSALLIITGLNTLFHQKLITESGYQTAEQTKAENAEWEKQWLGQASVFSVEGGNLSLNIHPATRTVEGTWQLQQIHSANGVLHATLPHGFTLYHATVNGHDVPAKIQHDHLALPLDQCTQNHCDAFLSWSVSVPAWPLDSKSTPLMPDSLWLRAEDVVPRLGIDFSRILRVSSDRQRYGLDHSFSLPAAATAIPVEAVAPTGHWHWQTQINLPSDNPLITQDSTDGPLSFTLFWAPHAQHTPFSQLSIIHDPTRTDTAHAIAEDVQAMRTCVSRRLGADIDIQQVVQWPRGLGHTRFNGLTLQLAEQPHWDVAEHGVGRWLRRAQIASALTQAHLIAKARLRNAAGSLWLSEGVSGAVGLLCVGDTDGLDALQQVMVRYADKTTRTLVNSAIPISSLATAQADEWTQYYLPLATLDWAAQQQPADFAVLLDTIRQQQNLAEALTAHVGAKKALEMLGPPLASESISDNKSDPHHQQGWRWRWQDNNWQTLAETPEYHPLKRINGTVQYEMATGSSDTVQHQHAEPGLLLDAWPSYERTLHFEIYK